MCPVIFCFTSAQGRYKVASTSSHQLDISTEEGTSYTHTGPLSEQFADLIHVYSNEEGLITFPSILNILIIEFLASSQFLLKSIN